MWLTVAVYISSISISFHDFTSLCSHCRKMWFLFWLICDSDHNFFHDTHGIRFFILIWATSIETCSDGQSKCNFFFCVYLIIIWMKYLTAHTVYRNCSDPICVSRGTLLFSWISALFSMATTMTAYRFCVTAWWHVAVVAYWILWGSGRNMLECSAVSPAVSKLVWRPALYYNFSLDTLQRRSVCFLNNVWCVYALCGVRKWQTKKLHKIWAVRTVRPKLISRNAISIRFQSTD